MSTPDPLRASRIRALMETAAFPDVRVLGIVTSTNDVAARLAASGAGPGLAVIAEGQTAGRGRHGSAWASPPGSGLFLSALVDAPDAATAPLVAGAAGIAAATAIRAACDVGAALKWPNDVWLSGRKAGGVLIEVPGSGRCAIAGIGITIRLPAGVPVAAGAAPLAGLEDVLGRPVAREPLAAALLDALGACLELARTNPGEIERRYAACDALLGRSIVAETSGGCVTGRVASTSLLAGIELVLADGSSRQLRPEHTRVLQVT